MVFEIAHTYNIIVTGEKLEDNEVAEVAKDCMDAEDDDGMIPYARKSQSFILYTKFGPYNLEKFSPYKYPTIYLKKSCPILSYLNLI